MRDFIRKNGDFIPRLELQQIFHVRIDWLWYLALLRAIPQNWKRNIDTPLQIEDKEDPPSLVYEGIVSDSKCSSKVYNIMQQQSVADLAGYCSKWTRITNQKIEIEEYYSYFARIYHIKEIVKFRDFQYRLLLGKIFTNEILYKWKLVNSPQCDWCEKTQTIDHLLYECQVTCEIWETIQECIMSKRKLTKYEILSNVVNANKKHIDNFVVLITKQFIFQCKCLNKRPTSSEVLYNIDMICKIEMENAKKETNEAKVKKRWSPYIQNRCNNINS